MESGGHVTVAEFRLLIRWFCYLCVSLGKGLADQRKETSSSVTAEPREDTGKAAGPRIASEVPTSRVNTIHTRPKWRVSAGIDADANRRTRDSRPVTEAIASEGEGIVASDARSHNMCA